MQITHTHRESVCIDVDHTHTAVCIEADTNTHTHNYTILTYHRMIVWFLFSSAHVSQKITISRTGACIKYIDSDLHIILNEIELS